MITYAVRQGSIVSDFSQYAVIHEIPFSLLLPIHFHNSTNNLAKMKQLLGHSTIKSTEHYLKYTVDSDTEKLQCSET